MTATQEMSLPAVKEAIELVLGKATVTSVRGLARAAQSLLEARHLKVAETIFIQLSEWGKHQPLSVSLQVLCLEIENELGRAWLRQNKTEQAANLFADLMTRSKNICNDRLTGVIANNYARALLNCKPRTKERVDTAIMILKENIKRLTLSGYPQHLAAAHQALGDALSDQEPIRAEEHLKTDIEICRKESDKPSLLNALDCYGVFLSRQNRFRDAVKIHREELREIDHSVEIQPYALALANLAQSLLGQGHQENSTLLLREAADLSQQAVVLFSSIDQKLMLATTLENLGRTQARLGEWDDGIATLERSAEKYRDAGEIEIAENLRQLIDDLRISNPGGDEPDHT